MDNKTTKSRRPSTITLISVLAVYGGIMLFWFIFQAGVQGFGIGNTIFYGFGGIMFIVCGIGFWLMKKWAVYLYAVFAVSNQIVLLLTGKWTVMTLVIPAIIVFVGYKNLSKMS